MKEIMLVVPRNKHMEEENLKNVEVEWSSYQSYIPNKGNSQVAMSTPSYRIVRNDDSFLLDSPPCEIIVSNLWEDENDIDYSEKYIVEFASNACSYRGRNKNPLSIYISTLFKMQFDGYRVHKLLLLINIRNSNA
jgi:hypothetical protein